MCLCRVYAASKGYKVLYVTRDIKDVNLCDILLVANDSIISDEQIKYIDDSNKLREKEIEEQEQFFSLAIDDVSLHEIKILQGIESSFRDPRPIKMII